MTFYPFNMTFYPFNMTFYPFNMTYIFKRCLGLSFTKNTRKFKGKVSYELKWIDTTANKSYVLVNAKYALTRNEIDLIFDSLTEIKEGRLKIFQDYIFSLKDLEI